MSATARIPVVRNRIVLSEPRPRTRFYLFVLSLAGLALMLLYIWLQVQVNTLRSEITRLELQNEAIVEKNRRLRTERLELANYGRLRRIAQQLGLERVSDDRLIRIRP